MITKKAHREFYVPEMDSSDAIKLLNDTSYRLENPEIFLDFSNLQYSEVKVLKKMEIIEALLLKNSNTEHYIESNSAFYAINYTYLSELSDRTEELDALDKLFSFVVNVYAENKLLGTLKQGAKNSSVDYSQIMIDVDSLLEPKGNYLDIKNYNNGTAFLGKDVLSLFSTDRLNSLNNMFSKLFVDYSMFELVQVMRDYKRMTCLDFIDDFVYPIVSTDLDDFKSSNVSYEVIFDTLLAEGKKDREFHSLPIEWQLDLLKSFEFNDDEDRNTINA